MSDEILEHFTTWNYLRNNILDSFPDLPFSKLNELCLKLAKEIDKEIVKND